jgi:hypothetical protein
MRSLLIRLYPARWRARYGDEFEAILDERALGPFDVADILLGALDAQLRLRGRRADIQQGRGFSMSLRIGGIAAILGGALWAVGLFLGSGLEGADLPLNPSLLMITGSLALLVALAGLSAFQARTHQRLAWAAFALPAVGTIASIVGLVGTNLVGEPYWAVWFLGTLTFFVGSVLFAIATYRTAALSRGAAVLLGVASVVLPVAALTTLGLFAVVALIGFALGWVALGIEAIRLDRPATELRPA